MEHGRNIVEVGLGLGLTSAKFSSCMAHNHKLTTWFYASDLGLPETADRHARWIVRLGMPV
jgi:hypothetical protein